MRYLHPVAANEVFIASGVYKRYEGETLLPYVETWTMHGAAGGGRLIRIDQDGRQSGGWSGLAEVLQDDAKHFERYNLLLTYTAPDAKFKSMRVEYVFLDQYVQMSRSIDGGAAEFSELALPSNELFVRLLDINLFWGEALQASAEGKAERAVFVPLRSPNHAPGQLVKASALPEIERVEDGTMMVGKKTIPVRSYKTKGDRVIRLDQHDIPVMLHSRGNLMDVLTDYAHR